MLTEAYIEALLVDEDIADQEWKAWEVKEIGDVPAFMVWWWIADSTNTDRRRLS